jgi:hypothetical protein
MAVVAQIGCQRISWTASLEKLTFTSRGSPSLGFHLRPRRARSSADRPQTDCPTAKPSSSDPQEASTAGKRPKRSALFACCGMDPILSHCGCLRYGAGRSGPDPVRVATRCWRSRCRARAARPSCRGGSGEGRRPWAKWCGSVSSPGASPLCAPNEDTWPAVPRQSTEGIGSGPARPFTYVLASVASATLSGAVGRPVSVEVHVSNGLPGFTIVGLPDAAVREARDRVRPVQWPGLALAPGDGKPGPVRRAQRGSGARPTQATLRTPALSPDFLANRDAV